MSMYTRKTKNNNNNFQKENEGKIQQINSFRIFEISK